MIDIQIKTSSGRFLMIFGLLLLIGTLAQANGHTTWLDVFRFMSGSLATMFLINSTAEKS